MNTSLRLAGPAILALAFAANALHNHSALGAAAGHIPGIYPVVFFIGIGVILPAFALGRTVRRDPTAARPLGVAPSWRDALAVLAALAIGCALAARPLGPIVSQSDGVERIATLFAQLLIASTAEVMLFIAATGMALGTLFGGRHGWRSGLLLVVVSSLFFGLFHFTYPVPWNTLANAATVTVVWIGVATLFVVTRSLVAAVLLDNMMATVGFATRDLALPLPPAIGLLLALLAFTAFVGAFALGRRTATVASPSPAPR